MRKVLRLVMGLALISMLFTSCATVLGGKITSCQEKPQDGGTRQVRVAYIVVDALFGLLPLGVDFLTKAVYKPCPKTN
jgi:hypothetical protein